MKNSRFLKTCVFNENTHICEETEGHRDANTKKKHTFPASFSLHVFFFFQAFVMLHVDTFDHVLPMFFHENTHICEENEGDQESHAHQHNTHTWTQDEKKMKQLEKNMKKTWKTRVFWKPCVFNENTHICEKNEGHRDAKNKKKHTCRMHGHTKEVGDQVLAMGWYCAEACVGNSAWLTCDQWKTEWMSWVNDMWSVQDMCCVIEMWIWYNII